MLEVVKRLSRGKLSPGFALQKIVPTLRAELIVTPIEPILHHSQRRVICAGLSIVLGNALFAWIWSVWLPQPYENLSLRILASLLGLSLIWAACRVRHDPNSQLLNRIVGVVFWLDLPVFVTWMYLCNGGNRVWLGTMVAVVVVYYQLTDWRLASLGTVTGALLAWALFGIIAPEVPPVPDDQGVIDALVIAFAWVVGLVLGMSSANLRRTQLTSSLATMGIMAHELRTPLAAANLLGNAIHMVSERRPDHPDAAQLVRLGSRLQALVNTMNHQIDTQIANARLLQLQSSCELVDASELVRNAVAAYPFPSEREKMCVKVTIYGGFIFRSSAAQFSQVMDNLIKNALRSLTAADSEYHQGALSIEVFQRDKRGFVVVTDTGGGIDARLVPHIFKPFISTNHSTGHGLGLAFCQQVVQSAGGNISVKSQIGCGASFMIELPVAD